MKRILSLVALILTACGTTLADQITLKNGDRVSGRIAKTDGGKLIVKTELLGEVAVDLASITNISGAARSVPLGSPAWFGEE